MASDDQRTEQVYSGLPRRISTTKFTRTSLANHNITSDLEIHHISKHLSHEIQKQNTLTFIFHIRICKNVKEKLIIFTKYPLLTTPCQQTVKMPLQIQNSLPRAFLRSIYLVSRYTYYQNNTLIS